MIHRHKDDSYQNGIHRVPEAVARTQEPIFQ